jgi:hypothetical protein
MMSATEITNEKAQTTTRQTKRHDARSEADSARNGADAQQPVLWAGRGPGKDKAGEATDFGSHRKVACQREDVGADKFGKGPFEHPDYRQGRSQMTIAIEKDSAKKLATNSGVAGRTYTISDLASDQEIAHIVRQVQRYFRPREWLPDLESALDGAGSRNFMPEDWSEFATVVIDLIYSLLPDPHGDGWASGVIDLEDVKVRWEELCNLPDEWWAPDHPLGVHLEDHKGEFDELSAFFAEYEFLVDEGQFTTLYHGYKLDELLAEYLRRNLDIDLDFLDPILRGAIDLDTLRSNYLTICAREVQLFGSTWILTGET